MTAPELMAELKARGIRLRARGDRLQYQPREKVTSDLVERLVQCKTDLLILLRLEQELTDRAERQLDRLVLHRTPDGRQVWVNRRYRATLADMGWL